MKQQTVEISEERRITIPRSLLWTLYVEKQMTTWAVAEKLQCSQNTVVRRLHEYCIPVRGIKKSLPIDEIVYLYEVKGKSMQEIATIYQCSHTTIGQRLHEHYCLKESNKATANKNDGRKRASRPCLPTAEIIKSYQAGTSATAIAKNLKISRWYVLKVLHHAQITIRHSCRYKNISEDELVYLYTVAHMSTERLANLYHVRSGTIASRLRDAGVSLRGHRRQLDEVRICELYAKGISVSAIAKDQGCSHTAVRCRLERRGLYRGRKKAKSI